MFIGSLPLKDLILVNPFVVLIEQKFNEFSFPFPGDANRCRFDNVTLHTSAWRTSPFPRITIPSTSKALEKVLCGSEIPEPVYSYDKLNLVFSSDSYLDFKGFLFKYSLASQYNFLLSWISISKAF